MHSFMPEEVPQPLGWGTLNAWPDRHFYICHYIDMLDELPSAVQWAQTVSKLHILTENKGPMAPNGRGKFGFDATTHLGNVAVDNTWQDLWEALWTQQMRSLLEQEESLRGSNEEFTCLQIAFFEKVVPRLLRPLETGGRTIAPCLIHSDLWPGNIKPMANHRGICMFDSCTYWGHHEGTLLGPTESEC